MEGREREEQESLDARKASSSVGVREFERCDFDCQFAPEQRLFKRFAASPCLVCSSSTAFLLFSAALSAKLRRTSATGVGGCALQY